MEKNIKANKIVIILFVVLFMISSFAFSYDEILLYTFFHGDFNSNLKFVDEFRTFYSSPKTFSSFFQLSFVSEKISQNFDGLIDYTDEKWKASRKLPEKINIIFGTSKFGANITMGSFFPVFDREVSYKYSDGVYLYSNSVGEGDRYYQLYIYITPVKFLNIGVAYGRVFGKNTISSVEKITTGENVEENYGFRTEHLSGVYKFIYFEFIPLKAISMFGFIPKNISGSYEISAKNSSGTENTDYSWFVGIPFIFGGKLDLKRIILYGNYRFTEENIYSFDDENTYTFKGIDNSRWNMYEIGAKIIINNIFVQLLDLGFEKEKYFILGQDSDVPRLYSLKGGITIVYKNIFLKLRYRYLFGKAYFTFENEKPLTHIKGSRLTVALSFQL